MCKVIDNDAGKVAGGEEAFNAEIRGAPPISKVKRFNMKRKRTAMIRRPRFIT